MNIKFNVKRFKNGSLVKIISSFFYRINIQIHQFRFVLIIVKRFYGSFPKIWRILKQYAQFVFDI